MHTVYLVAGAARMRPGPSPARDLYLSALFVKSRDWVQATGAPWFILSAGHGLLAPGAVVAPDARTIDIMSAPDRRAWGARVIAELESRLPPCERIVALAGRRYVEPLEHYLSARAASVELPLAGLPIGKQLQWLTVRAPA